MEIIDVSVPVRPGMVTYPGDPPVVLERVRSIARGDGYNLSRLDLGAHSGTHVGAPLHFVEGAASAETLPLDVLIGPARVVDLGALEGSIGASALGTLTAGTRRILLKTRNSELWARESLAVVAVEGLDLSRVEPGPYQLIWAPLKLLGAEGAPARTLLIRD